MELGSTNRLKGNSNDVNVKIECLSFDRNESISFPELKKYENEATKESDSSVMEQSIDSDLSSKFTVFEKYLVNYTPDKYGPLTQKYVFNIKWDIWFHMIDLDKWCFKDGWRKFFNIEFTKFRYPNCMFKADYSRLVNKDSRKKQFPSKFKLRMSCVNKRCVSLCCFAKEMVPDNDLEMFVFQYQEVNHDANNLRPVVMRFYTKCDEEESDESMDNDSQTLTDEQNTSTCIQFEINSTTSLENQLEVDYSTPVQPTCSSPEKEAKYKSGTTPNYHNRGFVDIPKSKNKIKKGPVIQETVLHIKWEVWSEMIDLSNREFKNRCIPLLNHELKHLYPDCLFLSKRKYIAKPNSRKKCFPQLTFLLVCSNKGCLTIRCLSQRLKPNKDLDLTVVQYRNVNHKGQPRGQRFRKFFTPDIIDQMRRYGPVATHNSLCKIFDPRTIPSAAAFTKVLSRIRIKERSFKQLKSDVANTQAAIESSDKTSTTVKGYIQVNCITPDFEIMILENALRALEKFEYKVLYLDSIDSIMKRINEMDTSNKIYYSAVFVDTEKDLPPIPFVEMLTENDDKTELINMFSWGNDLYELVNGTEVFINEVVLAYKSPVIEGCLQAFDLGNIVSYIDSLWDGNCEGFTLLNICKIQLINKYTSDVEKICEYKPKDCQKFLVFLFIKLQNSSSHNELFENFKKIVVLMSIKTENKSYLSSMESLQLEFKTFLSNENEKEKLEKLQEEDTVIQMDLKDQTKPGKRFSSIYETTVSDVTKEHGQRLNVYYAPALLTHLLTYYMPISPLWTSVNSSVKSLSNFVSWRKYVKEEVLKGTKMFPAEFLGTMYQAVFNRSWEYLPQPTMDHFLLTPHDSRLLLGSF